MKSETASLAELFEKESFYEIPDFQRPFSWDKDNFQDLIDDLLDTDFSSQYFFGSIVYYLEDGIRMVVDGQQRLTSFMILLGCIRDLIQDDKIKIDIQSLIIQPEDTVREIEKKDRLMVKDHEMFRKMVSEIGGTNAAYDARDFDEPSNRYIIARNIYREKLEKLNQETLIKFMKFASNRCVVIYLEADSFEEAFRLFEVVNDRGKQLRRIDLLKSFNLDPDFIPSKKKRAQLAGQWEQDESSIGEKDFESLFNIIRLIFTKSKPAEDLLSEFKKRIFHEGKLEQGEGFFSATSEFVDLYKSIFKDYSYLIGHPRNPQFRALMSIMDSELRTFEWRACCLAFSRKFGRDFFYEFCLAIEKIALFHAVKGVRKDERYSEFTSILTTIEKASKAEECIASMKVDETEIQRVLIEEDLYKRPYEKYVLLRLELAVAELDQVREFTARTAEHVFPQNPEDGSAWSAMANEEDRKSFVNKIGNLILLSSGKNSSASNRDFDEKKQKYLAPRVSDFPRSSQVLGYAEWTPEVINLRTREAATLILRDPAL